DFYSGATGLPGRFSEGFSLRRLQLADFRGCSIIPCCLAKNAAGGRVTGFGYASGSDTAAARMLAGRQAEIGDELARVAATREIADLSDDRCSDDWPDALEGLKGTDKPGPRRELDCFFDLR